MCVLCYKYVMNPISDLSLSLSLFLSLTNHYQFIVYFLYVYYKCRNLNKVTHIRKNVLVCFISEKTRCSIQD